MTATEPYLPSVLRSFLLELRGAGFDIGLEQFRAVDSLLVWLADRRRVPADATALCAIIRPIVCSSPNEQIEFTQHFDQWEARFDDCLERTTSSSASDCALSDAAAPTASHGGSQAPDGARRTTWTLLATTITLAVGVFASLWLTMTPPPEDLPPSPPLVQDSPQEEQRPPPPEPLPQPVTEQEPSSWGQLAWFAIMVLLIGTAWVSWEMWWRYKARLFLSKRSRRGEGADSLIPVQQPDIELFGRKSMRRVLQDFRRHEAVSSTELDVEATAKATARAAGVFTPVARVYPTVPQYLVLIDRHTLKDQYAALIDRLVGRFQAQEVHIARYFFSVDPRQCQRNQGPGGTAGLKELAGSYGSHRLMIFSDGRGLMHPTRSRVQPWVELFSAWNHKALLLPPTTPTWSTQLAPLDDIGFITLPASETGLTQLIEQWTTTAPESVHSVPIDTSYPQSLQDRPRRWLDRQAPPENAVDELVANVGEYLGERSFFLMSACAVYPALDWPVTLNVAKELGDGRRPDPAEAQHALSERQLLKLTTLPWFRSGWMPDWLRQRLIARLSREQKRDSRSAIHKLLLTAVAPTAESSQLEIATRPDQMSNLARRVVNTLARRSPNWSQLRDRVFLSFVGRKLAVPVPAPLRDVMRQAVGPVDSPLRSLGINALIVLGLVGFSFALIRGLEVMNDPDERQRVQLASFGAELGEDLARSLSKGLLAQRSEDSPWMTIALNKVINLSSVLLTPSQTSYLTHQIGEVIRRTGPWQNISWTIDENTLRVASEFGGLDLNMASTRAPTHILILAMDDDPSGNPGGIEAMFTMSDLRSGEQVHFSRAEGLSLRLFPIANTLVSIRGIEPTRERIAEVAAAMADIQEFTPGEYNDDWAESLLTVYGLYEGPADALAARLQPLVGAVFDSPTTLSLGEKLRTRQIIFDIEPAIPEGDPDQADDTVTASSQTSGARRKPNVANGNLARCVGDDFVDTHTAIGAPTISIFVMGFGRVSEGERRAFQYRLAACFRDNQGRIRIVIPSLAELEAADGFAEAIVNDIPKASKIVAVVSTTDIALLVLLDGRSETSYWASYHIFDARRDMVLANWTWQIYTTPLQITDVDAQVSAISARVIKNLSRLIVPKEPIELAIVGLPTRARQDVLAAIRKVDGIESVEEDGVNSNSEKTVFRVLYAGDELEALQKSASDAIFDVLSTSVRDYRIETKDPRTGRVQSHHFSRFDAIEGQPPEPVALEISNTRSTDIGMRVADYLETQLSAYIDKVGPGSYEPDTDGGIARYNLVLSVDFESFERALRSLNSPSIAIITATSTGVRLSLMPPSVSKFGDLAATSDFISRGLLLQLRRAIDEQFADNDERVWIVFGSFDVKSRLIPRSDSEFIRARVKHRLQKSDMWSSNVKYVSTRDRVDSRDDAAIVSDILGRTDPVRPELSQQMFFLNGEVYGVSRGRTHLFYATFSLSRADNGAEVFSEDFELKSNVSPLETVSVMETSPTGDLLVTGAVLNNDELQRLEQRLRPLGEIQLTVSVDPETVRRELELALIVAGIPDVSVKRIGSRSQRLEVSFTASADITESVVLLAARLFVLSEDHITIRPR